MHRERILFQKLLKQKYRRRDFLRLLQERPVALKYLKQNAHKS